jgi:hypothetical protein
MAKKNMDLYERLRESGVRKKIAKQVARVTPDGKDPRMKPLKRAADDLGAAASEIRDLVTGGPQKRSKAAKKAAKTRKKNKAERSKAAKKGARKRKKS